ncbi:MAG: rod shape-determining protein RodA [Chloroflexota bacterium]|jgi:rod shape determining protein RodA
MGVMRVERRRVSDWTDRSSGAAWRSFDPQLTFYAALLICIGLAMAYSNSSARGPALEAGTTFTRALLWAALAVAAFAISAAFDYRWLKALAWPLYFLNLLLLVLTLVVGVGVGGSSRWVSIGGLTFQFSELAKILTIVMLANYLSARWGKLRSLGTIVGACLLVVPSWVLVMAQPDLGTSLVFAAILAGMLFMSGASLRWLGLLAAGVVAAIPFAWEYVLRDYQKQRIITFLDPSSDPQGSGYQLIQSQIAIGSGGWAGKGLTNGTQNGLDFLPVQTTDFVFALLGEELGFIGAMLVFALFTALTWRILVAAWRSRDPFGLLFASGIASMILFQLVVNVGMVIGIMPVTGIPLPFITHGGASLISISIGLGILQSVNMHQRRAEW